MKVAMPVFGRRVSPRFDCANSFVVATIAGKEVTVQHEFDATKWSPHERIDHLLALRVDAVVCGGIDWRSAARLRDAGITLYSGVTGTSKENLDALVKGALIPGQIPLRPASEPVVEPSTRGAD